MVSTLRGRKAVVAKLGMDAHWRGAIVVANALRDAGMEVVYLGHASPAEVAAVSMEEDVDLVGLSSLSGNHLTECAQVMEQLGRAGNDDVTVVLGGTVPPGDEGPLKELGVDAVFSTGSSLKTIVARVGELIAERRASRAG